MRGGGEGRAHAASRAAAGALAVRARPALPLRLLLLQLLPLVLLLLLQLLLQLLSGYDVPRPAQQVAHGDGSAAQRPHVRLGPRPRNSPPGAMTDWGGTTAEGGGTGRTAHPMGGGGGTGLLAPRGGRWVGQRVAGRRLGLSFLAAHVRHPLARLLRVHGVLLQQHLLVPLLQLQLLLQLLLHLLGVQVRPHPLSHHLPLLLLLLPPRLLLLASVQLHEPLSLPALLLLRAVCGALFEEPVDVVVAGRCVRGEGGREGEGCGGRRRGEG